MSAHTFSTRWQNAGRALAVFGLLMFGVGVATSPLRAWSNLLASGWVFVSAGAGALALLALMHVANAGWAVVVKRVMEAVAGWLPLGALVLLAVLFGVKTLYPWARPEAHHDALLLGKAGWLNVPFFAVRMVVLLGLWSALALKLGSLSRAQDTDGSLERTHQSVRWSAATLILLALTLCIAAFDWLMSLEPHWFSTIFGLYYLASALVAGVASVIVFAVLLKRAGLLPQLSEGHLHDLGKLLLGFSTFWAYLWFSQVLLIWYANLPEETSWFERRWQGGWEPWFYVNLIAGWAVPFFLLLPRAAKRSPKFLGAVAAWALLSRWLDAWVTVLPANVEHAPVPGLLELGGLLGVGGLFLWVVSRSLVKTKLIAENDPYLVESLHHTT